MTRLRAALGMAALGLVLVAGCTAPAAAVPAAPPARSRQPAPRVTVGPPDGATGGRRTSPSPLRRGRHASGLTLTADDGKAVARRLSAGGSTWTATADRGSAPPTTSRAPSPVPAAPRRSPARFRTVAPKRYVTATTTIGDGQTVGVAAPIMIQFRVRSRRRAGRRSERALRSPRRSRSRGRGRGCRDAYGGSRVHWRPGLLAGGHHGDDDRAPLRPGHGRRRVRRADLTTDCTIGRSQIVRADARSHRIQVVRDGQLVMDLPASYGADCDPRRITRSGTHIV